VIPFRSLAVAVALALPVAAADAAPAAASGPGILLSRDGVHYAESLGGAGLFDGVGRLVPGDTVTSGFWVGNPLPVPVSLRVSVGSLAFSSPELARGLRLLASDSSGTTTEIGLDMLDRCEVILPSSGVPAGGRVRIELALAVLDEPARVAQDDRGSLDFVVAMRDAEAGPFPASACDDAGAVVPVVGGPRTDDGLARTGAAPTALPLLTAGFLLGGGLYLVRRRRRETS
jgi:LPXTG-motif cell wall-anchored protein